LCVAPPECNADTATAQVNLTETIPFGDPLPDPTTTYEDDGTQCVATTVTYVNEEGTCQQRGLIEYEGECYDCTTIDKDNFRACNGVPCGNGVFAKTQEECPSTDVCSGDGLYPEEGKECVTCPANTPNAGKSMSTLAACGEPIIVGPECEDPQTDEEKLECGWVECPNGGIAENLEACGDTTVTTCLDETANNFNEEGPCVYGPVEDICENGAIDYPECTECADGSLPDFETGCAEGPIEDPCDDPVYAAENPTECTSGPDCVDCTCPEYAAANPEECIGTPPPTGGGGGGGGGDQGKIEPIEIGISGDPELLARQEFPITDYLSGLFTGRR